MDNIDVSVDVSTSLEVRRKEQQQQQTGERDREREREQEQEEYIFDESNRIQLKSTSLASRRRRRAYGRKRGSGSAAGVNAGAVNGFGWQSQQPQHHRSKTSDESSFHSKSLSSLISIPRMDELSQPLVRHPKSNSFSAIRHFKSDADAIGSSSSGSSNENAHPNINPFESLSFTSNISNSSCFSSISRSATKNNVMQNSSNSTTSKTFNSFSESNDQGFTPSYLSPPRRTHSTRKRGVCDSPIVHLDEISSNGGISISRHSTSSYGSRRARSRIFSPDSTKKIMEALAVDACDLLPTVMRQKNEESFHESDCEEDEHSTSFLLSTSADVDDDVEADHDADGDGAGNLGAHDIDKMLSSIPRGLNRISSVGDGNFEDVIFAPVEIKTGKDDHSSLFETMSSYEDLKFLTKELRKWKIGKDLSGFGSMRKMCTVVPPKQWGHERKAAFNSWITNHLGFCHRSGGGVVSYYQTSQSKGLQALKNLEASLLSYKGKSKDDRPKPRRSVLPVGLPMSSIKIMPRKSCTPLLPSLKGASLTTPTLPGVRSALSRKYINAPMSIDKQSPACDAVEDIMDKLDSMDIVNDENDDVMTTDNNAERRGSFDGSKNTPLSRMVTLDDNPIPCYGRPSCEHSIMNNGDFMSQMHGISPRVNPTEHLRPAPLALSNKKNLICTMSPCIQPVDFDCVETPMLKTDSRRWGSRPIPGKDWGVSSRCDEKVIEVLTAKMEDRISHLNKNMTSSGSCGSLLDNATLVHPEISAIRADSTLLGFDNEVESYCSASESCEDENEDSGNELCNDNVPSFSALDLNEHSLPTKDKRRREKSLAKRSRISICESALGSPRSFRLSSVHSKKSFAYCNTMPRPSIDILHTLDETSLSCVRPQISNKRPEAKSGCDEVCSSQNLLFRIFSHFSEHDLLCTVSLVSSQWSDVVTDAHASLMLMSVGCSRSFAYDDDGCTDDSDESSDNSSVVQDDDEGDAPRKNSIVKSMERPWNYLVERFPWGMFLSEGAFKRVYKVWNSSVQSEEAISVMDIDRIGDVNVVGRELSVSVMLSSMARRNICPNFVLVRGVFTSQYEPSVSHWGSAEDRKPLGGQYDCHKKYKQPRKPASSECGSFQYIRMELCRHGDVEEYIKKLPGSIIPPDDARALLFQMAFSLHVAGNKFGMKHYDIKLLNFFLDNTNDDSVDDQAHPHTVLRYGLGSHVFNVRMKTSSAVLVKLADFGTANIRSESNGQPVTIANFTTLENTPPDFMILGDAATQGYGHDSFGLGLCMLHLFTGYAPYEEILDEVRCPPNLKKKLRHIWESEKLNGYEVIKSIVLGEVIQDEEGDIIEGEPDETLCDTLYRFFVLFGKPKEKFQSKEGSRVWRAIDLCLGPDDLSSNASRRSKRNAGNISSKKEGLDFAQYNDDCKLYSLFNGENEHIARARKNLESMKGGMDLLFALTSFDPKKRASPLDVMNSKFMEALREGQSESSETDLIYSYMSLTVN